MTCLIDEAFVVKCSVQHNWLEQSDSLSNMPHISGPSFPAEVSTISVKSLEREVLAFYKLKKLSVKAFVAYGSPL